MGGAILVASLGIVAAILVVLFLKLNEEDSDNRYPLMVMLFAFLLGIIVLLGKASLDYQNDCEWLVQNSTVAGNVTSYEYGYTCNVNSNSTAGTFYDITVWVLRLVSAYLVLTFAWEAVGYFGWKKRGGKQE